MLLHGIEIPVESSRVASKRADRSCILTINGGSSSLKFALFELSDRPARLLSGRVERIGMPGSRLVLPRVAQIISPADSKVAVHVIPTDEESMIAGAAAEFIRRSQSLSSPHP
jgi:acetate kinase